MDRNETKVRTGYLQLKFGELVSVCLWFCLLWLLAAFLFALHLQRRLFSAYTKNKEFISFGRFWFFFRSSCTALKSVRYLSVSHSTPHVCTLNWIPEQETQSIRVWSRSFNGRQVQLGKRFDCQARWTVNCSFVWGPDYVIVKENQYRTPPAGIYRCRRCCFQSRLCLAIYVSCVLRFINEHSNTSLFVEWCIWQLVMAWIRRLQLW